MPGGLVLFASFYLVFKWGFDSWLTQINTTLSYIILVVGFLIGLQFHRSRLAFTVLLLFLSDRILHHFGPGDLIITIGEINILYTIAALLPINLTLLALSRESGLLNIYGLLRVIFITIQPMAAYVLLEQNPDFYRYFEWPAIAHFFSIEPGKPLALYFLYGITLLFLMGYGLISNKATMRGFFWALAASGIAFYGLDQGMETDIFFCIGGLIVILSLLETAYFMAYHDELTGLPARRSLNTTMQNLGRKYTIAMLDIDFFKKFNDKYGHDVGDQVLCMVASHMSRVGGGGKPFRYGGEEFTIVFPGKTKIKARHHLENLRKSIAEAKFIIRGKDRPRKTPKTKQQVKNTTTVSVTISIGTAEPTGVFNKPLEVLKSADKALYQAKKKGRNCTV